MSRGVLLFLKSSGVAIFLAGALFLFIFVNFSLLLGSAISGGANALVYVIIAASIALLVFLYGTGIRKLWKWIDHETWSSKSSIFFISSFLLITVSALAAVSGWFLFGRQQEIAAEKEFQTFVLSTEKCNQALESALVVHEVQELYVPEVRSVKLIFLTTVTEDIQVRPSGIIDDNVEYFKFFWPDEVLNNEKGVEFSKYISGAYPQAREIKKGDSKIEIIMIVSPYVVPGSGQSGLLPWDGLKSFTFGPIFSVEDRCDGAGFVPGQNFSYKTKLYSRSDFGTWTNGSYQ